MVVLERVARRRGDLDVEARVRERVEAFHPQRVLRHERDVLALGVLRVGVPAHHEGVRVHRAEHLVRQPVLVLVLRVGGEVGEEGPLVDPEVGDAGLHRVAVDAAHPHDEVLAGALAVARPGVGVDLGVGLAGVAPAQVVDLRQPVRLGHRDQVLADDDGVLQPGDGEGDDE